MEFTEQVFNILLCNLENGESFKEEVIGFIADDTGLGYFDDLDERGNKIYKVTHLASGFEIGARFYRCEDAENFIKAIVPLIDWKQPLNAMYSIEAIRGSQLNAKVKQALYDVIGGASNYDKRISRMPRNKHQQLLQRGREYAETEASK